MQKKLEVDLSAAIRIRNEHSYLIKSPCRDGKITSVFIAPADLHGFHSYCDNKRDGMDEEINLMLFNGGQYSVYVKYEISADDGQDYYMLLTDYMKEAGKHFNFKRYGLKPFTMLPVIVECFCNFIY